MSNIFNPILDRPFRGCSQMGGLPYLKFIIQMNFDETWPGLNLSTKDTKNILITRDRHPLSFGDISIFQ